MDTNITTKPADMPSLEDMVQLMCHLPHTSAYDLENFLEFMEDSEYLSSKGKYLRFKIWDLFIKEED